MNTIVVCPNCGTRNRVKQDYGGRKPICAKCRNRLPAEGSAPQRAVEVTDKTFESEVLSFPGTVLVGAWAPWCAVCPQMFPVWDGLAKQYGGRIKITRLNVDQNPMIANRFSILSIPTMLFFHKGRHMQTLNGAVPKSDIERQISAIR